MIPVKQETRILDAELDSVENFCVKELVAASFQFTLEDGTWGTAVVTIERSNDGVHFVGFSNALTASAEGVVPSDDSVIDCSAIACLRAKVTTLEGAASIIAVHFVGKGHP
jgi:hypothetical protein